jgi:hypothetical protein
MTSGTHGGSGRGDGGTTPTVGIGFDTTGTTSGLAGGFSAAAARSRDAGGISAGRSGPGITGPGAAQQPGRTRHLVG